MHAQPLNNRSVVVRLADGPCAGSYATVKAFGEDCYQRLARREDVWLRYVKNLFKRGEYVWSGEVLTTPELQARIAADKQNTYAASEGA